MEELILNRPEVKLRYSILKKFNIETTIFFIHWIILGGIIGGVVAPICVFFLNVLNLAEYTRESNPWIIIFLPIGGAFISKLYKKFGKGGTTGTNLVVEDIIRDTENLPLSMGVLAFVGTVVTHLFGGSSGRGGAAVQIGASISATIGRHLKMDEKFHKLLLMAGISAGFGAIFGTPLSGAIFALEVISVGKIEYDGLIPSVISGIIAQAVAIQLNVYHPVYELKKITVENFSFIVIAKVTLASMIFALGSVLFSQTLDLSKKLFVKFFPNVVKRSFAGGIIVTGLSLLVKNYDYIGIGTNFIKGSFFEVKSLMDPILKIVFTALTLGAGFQGGEITPLFFTGAALGSAISPYLGLPTSFLASLGLIAVFAGATNTPIAGFIMGIELFGGENISYFFIACMITYLFSGRKGIYTSQRVGVEKAEIFDEDSDGDSEFSEENQDCDESQY